MQKNGNKVMKKVKGVWVAVSLFALLGGVGSSVVSAQEAETTQPTVEETQPTPAEGEADLDSLKLGAKQHIDTLEGLDEGYKESYKKDIDAAGTKEDVATLVQSAEFMSEYLLGLADYKEQALKLLDAYVLTEDEVAGFTQRINDAVTNDDVDAVVDEVVGYHTPKDLKSLDEVELYHNYAHLYVDTLAHLTDEEKETFHKEYKGAVRIELDGRLIELTKLNRDRATEGDKELYKEIELVQPNNITDENLTEALKEIANVVDTLTAFGEKSFEYKDEAKTKDNYKDISKVILAAFQDNFTVALAKNEEPVEGEPETTEPEVTTPEETTQAPEVTTPEVTEPEETTQAPEVTEPEVTEPETTEPEVTEPETTEPETTEAPEETTQAPEETTQAPEEVTESPEAQQALINYKNNAIVSINNLKYLSVEEKQVAVNAIAVAKGTEEVDQLVKVATELNETNKGKLAQRNALTVLDKLTNLTAQQKSAYQQRINATIVVSELEGIIQEAARTHANQAASGTVTPINTNITPTTPANTPVAPTNAPTNAQGQLVNSGDSTNWAMIGGAVVALGLGSAVVFGRKKEEA